MQKSEIKIRYSPTEIEILKEKASKLGKTINEYQIEISKRAIVKIEVRDE